MWNDNSFEHMYQQSLNHRYRPPLTRSQEFAGSGDLFEDLKRHGGQLKERQAAREVVGPFLNALAYMHVKVRVL